MDDSTHVCSTLQGNGQVLMLHRLAQCLQDVLDSCPSAVKGYGIASLPLAGGLS